MLLCANRKMRESNIPVSAAMASKLLLVVVFLLGLIAFAPAVAAEQRRTKPLCHDDESLALLQFKKSLTNNCAEAGYSFNYSKVFFWVFESNDCCKWSGVKCDKNTGHVVSLDLSSSCLFGTINSNSSLFQLVHLQRLNLANNWFNSHIPIGFRQLSRLTNLNLSSSGYCGQITSKVLELSNLVCLDLPNNKLELLEPSLRSLSQNLTNLEELHLDNVKMSSIVPQTLANLSSLTYLSLGSCSLYGEFPTRIFHLPNLQSLVLDFNSDLKGSIPEFNQSNLLESLEISFTSFSNKLPDSISNLKSLQHFIVIDSNFFGPIPSSFRNLSQLVSLGISGQGFHGEFPIGIFHLPNLRKLEIGFNENLTFSQPKFNESSPLKILEIFNMPFSSELLHSIGNLKSLSIFNVEECNLSEPIASSLSNLSQITQLILRMNNLHDSIPKSISKLINLEFLYLESNNLRGIMEFDLFFKLKNLRTITIFGNNFSMVVKPSTNATFQKLKDLTLVDCDLYEFPDFLRDQDQLIYLNLAWNKIHGQVPKWLWDAIKDTLLSLDLSFNFLTAFDESLAFSPLSPLRILELDSNKLQGPLPILSPSITWYSAPNNKLVGEIPHLICNLRSIIALDLSNNSLSGSLPPCLGNLSDFLSILNLYKNNFHGIIPQSFIKCNKLMMIDLSQNQLQGIIPKSLANCIKLEFLNLADNQINDFFPFWLGSLSRLKVLILRSNRFYGTLKNPNSHFDFQSLRIVDLSNHNITGKLPSQYFQTWKAMQVLNEMSLTYMEAYTQNGDYSFSMSLFNKGKNMVYEKVLDFLMVVDLSNNRFDGEIPKVVGHLKGLQSLNLSNNFLIGSIPSSLEYLTELESLDISQNKLSGAIPLQLVQLTFLAFLNLSHNHLTGPIPHGKQFDTFPNTSFSDNPGLCGSPLLKKCENFKPLHSPTSTFGNNQNWKCLFEFNWKVVAIGYGCGFVVGFVLGSQRSMIG